MSEKGNINIYPTLATIWVSYMVVLLDHQYDGMEARNHRQLKFSLIRLDCLQSLPPFQNLVLVKVVLLGTVGYNFLHQNYFCVFGVYAIDLFTSNYSFGWEKIVISLVKPNIISQIHGWVRVFCPQITWSPYGGYPPGQRRELLFQFYTIRIL